MDLRELMDQRSAQPPASIHHHLRLAAVRRKVATRRRYRWAAGAAAVVALVSGTGAAALTWSDRAAPPSPAEGFPAYAEGARVVAAAAAPLSERTATVTFVPATTELVLFLRCDVGDPPESVDAEVTVNDVRVWSVYGRGPGGFCGTAPGHRVETVRWDDYAGSPDDGEVAGFAEAGLRVGEPATVTMTVAGGGTDGDAPGVLPGARTLSGGTFAVAVGERVPFAEYQLPPRPDPLPSLRIPAHGEIALLLRSDPADPGDAVTARLDWSVAADLIVQAGAQTPGFLTVLVDGIEVGRVEFWTYRDHCRAGPLLEWSAVQDARQRRAGPAALLTGEVTVTVRPEHMTGDWYVRLNPAGHLYC